MPSQAEDRKAARRVFFKRMYRTTPGYVCIAFLSNDTTRRMHEEFFRYPEQLEEIVQAAEVGLRTADVYYCPQLLKEPRRTKESIRTCTNAWADLDECSPEEVSPRPSVIIESSPGRYQALWSFEDPTDPLIAQEVSKRIAYAYQDQGCDISGWDLTQLLRMPETPNWKYRNVEERDIPWVRTIEMTTALYRLEDFKDLPEVQLSAYEQLPMPESFREYDVQVLWKKYGSYLSREVASLFHTPAGNDMSKDLFRLQISLFEAGAAREEVYVLAEASACNKFARDGHPDQLWADVCRAESKFQDRNEPVQKSLPVAMSPLMTEEERERVKDVHTFVERYIEWASRLGDAATQYHQAGAFVILSALLAGRVRLPTSFGIVIPNLWFMILADTTLTRKSTAMDIAVDLLAVVDDDAIMATDGSIEGLLTGLSMRPGRASIFLRDEFSGLLEQIFKKDYMAGMAETLTKLYDGKMSKRLLKKEVVEVREPVLIAFTGGIRNRVQQLLSLDHISSGFIPRFLFITAVSDVEKVQPLGPPVDVDISGREELLEDLRDMKLHYHVDQTMTLAKGTTFSQPRKFDVRLDGKAWARYNKFERALLQAGMESDRPDLMTPLYSRLGVSTLKATMLLAASKQRDDEVLIQEEDVLLGIRYAEEWRSYAIEVVNGVGKTAAESDLERIQENIRRNPGITRSSLMRSYHLTAREADAIFNTLEQRGVIAATPRGRGKAYVAVR